MSKYLKNTPSNPADTPAQILSPITQALENNGLTLERLCSDLDQTIKTTKKQPIARLRGLDMGFRLQDAYPEKGVSIPPGSEIVIALRTADEVAVDTTPKQPDQAVKITD